MLYQMFADLAEWRVAGACSVARRSSQTTNLTIGLLVNAAGSTRRVIIRGRISQARSGSGSPRRRAAAPGLACPSLRDPEQLAD